MTPSFQPEESSRRQQQSVREPLAARSVPRAQSQIISQEADVAGLVLQYEHTYGDRLRKSGWDRPSEDNYFEVEALRNASTQLSQAFLGEGHHDSAFGEEASSSCTPRFDSSYSDETFIGSDSPVPELDGFEVRLKSAFIKMEVSRADSVVLYEVRPERPSNSQRWAFPDRLSDNSLEHFGPHLELRNPVFVEVSSIDGEESLGFIFSEKAASELVDLAMRDIERMPNEFLYGLKHQCLHSARKIGVAGAFELDVSDIEIAAREKYPRYSEIIIEARPLGLFQLKLIYDPQRSQLTTASRRVNKEF